jgi:class 3 adenylate cyclase/DNA-binding winged helix-turn-helix (wHTH) protein/predicted ATPase
MLYSFGDYTLDAEHYELRQAGRLVPVEPRVLDVLAYLVQHPDRTVTTEELLAHLYPKQFAPVDRLTNAVAQARKVLGDTGQTQRYIQTVRRRGYRFMAPVTARPPAAADLSAAPTPDPIRPPALPTLDQGQAVSPPAPSLPASPSARLQTSLSYTPVHLAEKILSSRSALEGERKQVTVLFADLKGSLELIADRDPEEAWRLLDPLLERMMEAVHRYEGTVNHLLGDGIMALFGAPLAHEDHALRACYAALTMQEVIRRYAEELRRANGIDIQLRVGLNSGDVVVGAIGNDLHMEYSAIGQTTHLAARMEQLAPPGGIWMTAETFRLVEGYVQVKPLGPIPIRGRSSPMDVYELTGAEPTRTRLQAAATRILTRFVGRQPEIETLRQAQERASTGHGQVVAVIGEPGMGKSRLFYEFTHAQHMQGWLILEAGAVSSYGQATPYLPIIDLLKAYFQVEGPDDGRGMHEKVTAKLLTLDEALRPTLPAFRMLLDIPVEDPQWQALDPRQRRQRTLDAIKRLLLRESQIQPVLVIVENLHWIDTETQAFLDSFVESLPTARFLLLVNYRPEYQHGWGNKTAYTQLRLDPLPLGRAEELLQALLGNDSGLQSLKRRLIERTEGNPFFLEESVWALAETKALVGERGAYRLAQTLPSIQVPATVQAVLATRIDRLPPEDKRLLQAAAVIGRDVPFPLLQAIAEGPEEALRRSLAHLQGVEFLYELHLFPEHFYTFKHALTQEVAYQSLLQRTRKQYHQQIAQVLIERFPDTVATRPELLAHHYTAAGLSAQAVPYWQRAGQRALEHSAYAEAIQHLTTGLHLLAPLPEAPARAQQELDLQLALGPALIATKGRAAPEVEQTYARARVLCQQLGDTPRLFPALLGLSRFYQNRGALPVARELGAQLDRLAQGEATPTAGLEAQDVYGTTLFFLGEYAAARAHLESDIALIDPVAPRALALHHGIAPEVRCLAVAANALWCLGYPAQARRRSQEALALAQELVHPHSLAVSQHSLAVSQHFAAFLHQRCREAPAVQARAEALLSLATAQGFPLYVGYGTCWRGWALAAQGQGEAGLAQLRQGMAAVLAMGQELSRPLCLTLLAEAAGHAGQAAEGLHLLAEALAAFAESKRGDLLPEAHRLRGEALLRQAIPDAAQAAACFQQALTIARRQQAKSWELRAAMSLSRLWQQQGQRAEAYALLAPLYDWFTEGFDTADLQEAKALLQDLA